jgi:hypothetical protein
MVPFSVKVVPMKIDVSHLLLGDSYTGWVPVGIKLASDPQTSARGGSRDQVDDHLMADQGLAPPILTDEGEESMFDLVPLAGSGRKMRDGKLQLRLLRQSLQLPLPQSQSSSIAPSRISGNEQALGLGIRQFGPSNTTSAECSLPQKSRCHDQLQH